jgi:hypothetical protein
VITANLNENMVAHTELMNLRMQHRAAVSLLSDSSVARPPWSARTACWVACPPRKSPPRRCCRSSAA